MRNNNLLENNKVKESDFLSLLRTAKKPELEALAKLLMPYIADLELRQPRIWGDKKRVHLERATIHINDLLINTRSGHVTIEEDCFFGHRCMLLTGTHDYNKKGLERLKAVPDEGRDILIRKGVWLGSGVTVLGGVVIGENSVVAAGSLVTKNVPENCIVAGRPAEIIKEIDFSNSKSLESVSLDAERIVKKTESIVSKYGYDNAKRYLSNAIKFPNLTGFKAKKFFDNSGLKNFNLKNGSTVLVLGSKPGSKIFSDVDIVFGANASLSYYGSEIDKDVKKIAVWGALGTEVFEDVINSGVDEIFCLGNEPKVFENKHGVINREKGEVRYNVLSFFERRELVQEVTGSDSPFFSNLFFDLDYSKKLNLIKSSLIFLKKPIDSLSGVYDWPLPLRPSAGIFSLIIAIARFGASSNYVISGIGADDRYLYPDLKGGVKNKTSKSHRDRIEFYGLDSHVEADLEILRFLSKKINISTTDKSLSEASGVLFLSV